MDFNDSISEQRWPWPGCRCADWSGLRWPPMSKSLFLFGSAQFIKVMSCTAIKTKQDFDLSNKNKFSLIIYDNKIKAFTSHSSDVQRHFFYCCCFLFVCKFVCLFVLFFVLFSVCLLLLLFFVFFFCFFCCCCCFFCFVFVLFFCCFILD